MPPADPTAGLTVRDVSRRYRVGEDKVRGWIRTGLLEAVNTAATLSGRPRWVILPQALERFEAGRRASAPKPRPRRRRRAGIDFYPG
jgi:hypothetical protein